MKRSFGKLLAASLAALVLASFAMAPYADAASEAAVAGAVAAVAVARGGGGGAGARRRWRRRRQAGAQVNNSRADARTNNVRRHNSVNNVNVERNVNVNVDNGCCNSGWDNDYHPVACRRGGRGRRRDVRRHRLDGAHVAAELRAGELRRHGLPAVRRHLVSAPGIAVRRGQSAVLIVRLRTQN